MRQVLALLVVVAVVGTTLAKQGIRESRNKMGLDRRARYAAIPQRGKRSTLKAGDLMHQVSLKRSEYLRENPIADPLHRIGDAVRRRQPALKSVAEELARPSMEKLTNAREMVAQGARKYFNSDFLKQSARKFQKRRPITV